MRHASNPVWEQCGASTEKHDEREGRAQSRSGSAQEGIPRCEVRDVVEEEELATVLGLPTRRACATREKNKGAMTCGNGAMTCGNSQKRGLPPAQAERRWVKQTQCAGLAMWHSTATSLPCAERAKEQKN